jgi:hypothetical protein
MMMHIDTTINRLSRIAVGLLTAVFAGTIAANAGDGSQPLRELRREHDIAHKLLLERLERAKTDAERAAIQAERWKELKDTARRAFGIAEAATDGPEAIDAIVWTIHGLANGSYPEYRDEQSRA